MWEVFVFTLSIYVFRVLLSLKTIPYLININIIAPSCKENYYFLSCSFTLAPLIPIFFFLLTVHKALTTVIGSLMMYSFMGGGLFCAIVGNILLVVSTATDYWMQYRLSGSFAHQGLWRYCMSGKCYMQTDSIGK